MIKAFRKIVSKTPDLNEVQQNVFETVQDLQQIDVVQHYDFEDQSDLADSEEVELSDPIALTEGRYLIQYGGFIEVAFSSSPTVGEGYFVLKQVPGNTNLVTPQRVSVNDLATGTWKNGYFKNLSVNTTGLKIQLVGFVDTAGGSSVNRKLIQPFVTIFRRNL